MTKSQLLSLLRDAEPVVWEAVGRNVNGAEETHRHIARALRTEDAATSDGTCASCGNALTQPSTGRPRMYCGETCKKRAQRARARIAEL